MSKIKVMSENLANKIAAGEVVEKISKKMNFNNRITTL